MGSFRKAAALFVAVMMVAPGSAFAQARAAKAALAPGGASGIHAAQDFNIGPGIYVVAGIGLVLGGLALTQLHYHNPGNGSAKAAPAEPSGASGTN